MPRPIAQGLVVAASVVAAAGWPVSVFGQDVAPPPPAAVPVAVAPPQPAATPPAAPLAVSLPRTVQFNFKDAPIDQVLDFFAREAGVPIIFEAPAPAGTLTFVSGSAYDVDDALSILNLNLQRFGVHLRRQEQYLYLATTADSMKKPSPVTDAAGVDGLTPDQIVTVSIPLDNARAETVAEQLKGLVGPMGGVLAVPAQNMVIIVETAAQVRRLREIIEAVDAVRPADSAFRLFPLKHAQAEAVLAALKGLVGERTKMVIVDKDGQQRVVQDQQVSGLNLAADPRTNSIVAVGPEARIKTVEELVQLLDVPEAGQGDATMMTFTLGTVGAEEAARQVNALFASVDAKRRPVVMPMPQQSKLTVIGTRPLLAQAASLLAQVDPDGGPEGSRGTQAMPERRAVTVRLRFATFQTVEGLASRLLTPRQQQVVRLAPAPDGKGVIVAGPDRDVAAVEALVAAIDVAPDVDRDVRLVKIGAPDPAAVLARTVALYEQTGKTEKEPVVATLDAESRTLTLIGTKSGLAAFDALLKSAETAAQVELESRTFTVRSARPSVLAGRLSRLARPLLTPADGSAYVEPQVEAIDELSTLLVRAQPGQFDVLAGLIERLDARDTAGRETKVVRLSGSDPGAVLSRARKLFDERVSGMAPDPGAVAVELDEASGAAVLSGGPEAMRIFDESLSQSQMLLPPERVTRVIDVQNVPAAQIVDPLRELLASADPIDPARKVPAPTVQVIERTNSLLIHGEEAQQRMVAETVARLDRLDAANLPPLRLLQLRTADAASIAGMLGEQYGKRAQAERSAKPVDVRADPATNTLIVSAHPDLFDEIRKFVEDLNKEAKAGSDRVTQIFPLKVAKAVDVAAAMDKLYPTPPAPTDRLGRPQPWLQQPKEVVVSAEATSNSLIIDAPADRLESLQELAAKLDRVELPPAAELRTYRVRGPSLDAVAKTLQSMAQRGIMTEPAQPGRQPVQVMIETEPKSSTLIVAGDARTFATVETVLTDLSLVPVEKGLRVVPIANERAAAVRIRALEIYDAQVAQLPNANPIEVTVDESTNSLMVVADGEAMARFMGVMEELQRQGGPAREVRLIELKLAKAEKVVEFLRDLVGSSTSLAIRGGPEPVIEAIEATNSLMIAAQPGQFAVIEPLVRSLDGAEQADRPPLRILRLRSSDAANLAMVLQKAYDSRPAEQRGKMPVSIEADAGTNALIVSAHPDVLPEIEAMVTQLNETQAADADGREIRIFPLKVARAEELAQTIDQMYPDPPVPLDPRTRQPRPDLKPPREVVVRADRATNALIVDAPVRRLDGFEQLVRSLDQQKLSGDVELRAYRVERANLEGAAGTLRELAAGGSLGTPGAAAGAPVTISAEPATRTLIVSGPSGIFASVESVLKKLDALPDQPAREMKLFSLVNARAERLQPLVSRLLQQRAREMLAAEGKSPTPGEEPVEVSGDPGSNTLIVSAPRAVIAVADGLVRALDQQSVASGVEVRVFRLGKGDAAGVAKAVADAVKAQSLPGEPDVTVTPEPGSNTIVVVGTAAQVERAGKLVETMDTAVDREGLGVRTISLKFARAESIAPVLESVLTQESALDRLPEWARAQALARGASERPKVRVAAEPRLNSVVVSGPRALLDVAEQVVAELDADPALRGATPQRLVRVVTLRNSDADALAANLTAVFAEETTGEARPTIRVDAQSNSLIVRASPAQMTMVEELTKKLDSATVTTTRQMRMVPVDRSRADAELLARTLQRLLQQQGGIKVEVISAEQLLRGAPAEPAAEEPKKVGAAPSDQPRGSRSPRLSGREGALAGIGRIAAVAAHAAAMAFTQPVVDGTAPDAEAGDDAGVATIAVDRATNSLLFIGSPRITDRLAALAAELEREMPAEPVGVRVVTLASGVDSDGVAAVIRQTVQQVGRLSQLNPGGFTGPVSVLPDPAGSALIVLANDSDFETVGRLIASIARTGEATPVVIKIYPLSTVTAPRAIAAVADLFAPQPRGQQTRRVRAMQVTLAGEGGVVATIDPSLVRLTADPGGTSIIVAAPREAIPLIDRLVQEIDQNPVKDRLAIRRYALVYARAAELSRTLQALFDAQRQGPAAQELPQARFIADDRTNSLLVTAAGPQHADVERLLATADATQEEAGIETAILTLQQASPSTVQRIVEEVLVGRDPAKKDRVRVSAQDGSSLFVVRAPAEDIAAVRALVAQIDTAETGGLPVRSIKLERADAGAVATALQKFFADRATASSRPGSRVANRVAVVGDRRSSTLVVSASDEDFAQVESLTKTFDTPAAGQDLQFKVLALKHARVGDVANTIKSVAEEMQWQAMWGSRGPEAAPDHGQLFIEPSERTNSLVVMGRGEAMATVERVVEALDRPEEAKAATVLRSVLVRNADVNALRTVLQRAFATPGWRPWRGQDPEAVAVEIDRARRAVILVGRAERVEQALGYIKELDAGTDGGELIIESITLEHARADRAGETLRRFFAERARAQGVESSPINVVGSPDGNVLIVSGTAESLATLRDMVAQIDQPEGGKGRRIEVYALRNGVAADTAAVLRANFARSARTEESVVITPQPSTNSLIVSAPEATFEEVAALLAELDKPPTAETANIETIALTSARAADVAVALRAALPPNVKVTVTPVVRSNSLLLTGPKEAIALVVDQVRKLDTEPVRSGLVFRRFAVISADASDVAYTVEQVLRARPKGVNEPTPSVDYARSDNTLTVYAAADQIEEIERIIKELDTAPAEERTTEFVKLEFANAEGTAAALKVFYGRYAPEAATPAARAVTILPDPLSNSLVIRADAKQWEGIRALLAKLDTKEYDTTRQLAVIALEHAEAAGVARALNEGLRAPLEEQLRQAQLRSAAARRPGGRAEDVRTEATVLVDAEGVPSVSAEPQTNSLIVFAGGRELERIREIVRQLDVAGFADMPAARVIALRNGKPSVVAQTIRQLFLNKAEPVRGPRSVMVIGDDVSNALIVRADDERFAQISALAETLQQQGDAGRSVPHVIRLRTIAAGRLRATLLATFAETARAQGETLAVEVDRTSNALVIASSPRLLAEIRKVIDELDGPAIGPDAAAGPDAATIGQNVTIVDIANNDPAEIKRLLDDMGLSRPQPADRPGVVSEAVMIVPMTSRRALAIVAAPADGRAVEALVRALDAAPVEPQQQIAVIPLKMATAKPLVDTLNAMLRPEGGAVTGPGRALAEQIRRLGLSKAGVEQANGTVDLAKPLRLLADAEANAVIVASTQANIDALREVIKVLDTLPVGDAVLVRIFALENASAARVKAAVEGLFAEGEALRRLPGTNRRGLPPTATGQALAGEIAVAVDDRTNTLIVAGRDEAVALVEILVKDLDSDRASKWIEPVVIPLVHADASTLARKLQEVLVRGLAATPEAQGLQRQFGRLRMLEDGAASPATPDGGPAPDAFIEADLFAPLTGLVIAAEEDLNALLVIGSPANNQVVRRLVAMLDVEAAGAANAVRVFPLRYAASERIAAVLRDVFRQRQDQLDLRPEDAVIITSDVRTNSLIVATSAKSFAIVDGMLKTLDGEASNPSVGLHVIPVTNADVRQLAPRIERLMRERLQAAAQAGTVRNPLDAFTIEPEPTSNLLIVAASDENLRVVKELVDALTADAARLAGGERVDIIQLTRGRAAEVAASLRELYVDRELAKRGPGALSVLPNERLNALIVSGSEQDVAELRALANRLDTAAVTARQQVRAIELRSANAAEVVALLENVLAGRPVGGRRGVGIGQATKLQFLRERLVGELVDPANPVTPTEADLDGAIRDQVTLTADARTNSVWITAPEPMVALISEMIEGIEASSAGSRRIEKFELRNADARQMAELLRDTFNLRRQGNSLVLVPSGPVRPDEDPAAPGADGGPTVTAVPDERQQLAIAVDARTNTLIVSGTAEYLELVRKVVTELDSIEANERERRVYHLRNADATEIETTLKSYFGGESATERTTLGPQLSGSLVRRLEEEVTVVGDAKSNKLVISTSPRYMQTVLGIVKELDAAPPQVMIQVLLAEVTLDSDDTWGMDANIGPFGGEGYRIGSQAAGAGVATALGVPNLSVSSADFGVLIRALEVQGKLEVLSNPQVMVNNNQEAKIQVGDNVAIVDGVERTVQGTSFANVRRQDVGIILNVKPSISADGYVRMDITPEISQVSAKVTEISEDVRSPIINKRAVDTVVTVKDGQSVVIGGLIQTSEESRRTKIPILGDIPLLGLPFRTTRDVNVKTELLVILTPRVIPGQADETEGLVRDVTDQAIDRLEDPSKVLDYLERVRQEVKGLRSIGALPRPGDPQPPATPPALIGPRSSAEPSVLMPAPADRTPRRPARESLPAPAPTKPERP